MATGIDRSDFPKKTDLANLKLQVQELNIDKLADLDSDKLNRVSAHLKKISHAANNNVFKKTVHNKSQIIIKIDYDNMISDIVGKSIQYY